MTIHTLDLHFQGAAHTIASYLVIGDEGPVLVETGPGSTLTNLLKQLSDHGYSAADIKHILVTHIHLDHAGAAGWWGTRGATVHVHAIGAPHLVDPSRLVSSAARLYGARMDALWGDILPVPEERVRIVEHGEVVNAAGLEIRAVATPGGRDVGFARIGRRASLYDERARHDVRRQSQFRSLRASRPEPIGRRNLRHAGSRRRPPLHPCG